jgi:predicted ATPase/DNA-binding SARP family transcriptional activator
MRGHRPLPRTGTAPRPASGIGEIFSPALWRPYRPVSNTGQMTDGADRLEVGILGPFEASAAGQRIVIRGATERALLARLAIDGSRPVSNRRIADDLWGDQAPRRPKQAIHALVFRLRQTLGPSAAVLQTSDHGYALQLGTDALDLWRFDALVAGSRRAQARGDLAAAARDLTAALAVWRGDALTGLGDCPFVYPRARQLEETRFETHTERISVDLDRGLHTRLVPELEALALERPTHEGVSRLLMIALYRCGRQVDALAAYDRLRKRLAGQFGIDPSPPLQQLELELLRQDPKLGWRAPPGSPAPPPQPEPGPGPRRDRSRGGVPHPLTAFIGRETELADVVARVEGDRLVTIAGPGGCGKTRLAIAAAHRLAPGRELRFVRLEGLTDAALVAVAVAEALGIRLGTGQSATTELTEALADRDLLVVLDNCEHVLPACTELVLAILESAPGVRFLLTSREQLSVPGEAVCRLGSLASPRPGEPPEAVESSEAVRLFLDRAAAASGPAHPLGAAALPVVAEVCRRLDGIPLAIELAAARMVTLSLDQLSRRLADRFTVLQAGSRTALPRHRTLLAAMTWSHDLLDEQERCLFRRLSVFASAFPLEAAEAVCAGGSVSTGDVCDLVARLAAKSLLAVERDEDEVAYRMLSTIREYADSWLVDAAERRELAGRHHDWCLGQAAQAARAVHDGDQRRWARRLRSGMDDIRAALDWALGPEGETVALAAQMWQVWEMRGQDREGRRWIERALARPDQGRADGARAAERAALLLGAGVFARGTDEFDESRRLVEQAASIYQDLADAGGTARCCLELGRLLVLESKLEAAERCAAEARQQYLNLGDDWGVAWADVLAGNVLMVRGEYRAAARILHTALAAGRRLDNPAIVGDTLVFLGLVAVRSGRVSEASAHFGEALRIGRMLGSDSLVNVALANLGVVARHEGDHARALALLDEALVMARQRGEPLAVARILLESGEVASHQGEHFRSQAFAHDALRVYRRIGTFSPVPQCLDVLARASLSLGQIPRAATLLGAADDARRGLGLAAPQTAVPAGAQHAKQEWQRAWQRGIQLSMSDAIRFALDEAAPAG